MNDKYLPEINNKIDAFFLLAKNSGYTVPNNTTRPTISFDLKGRVAGSFNRRTKRIKLNSDILNNPKHTKEILHQTLGHELAHLLSFEYAQYHNIRLTSHGHLWKSIMFALGLDVKRCHSYETIPTRKITKFSYSCGCDIIHSVSSIKHNRISKGENYRCIFCKVNLFVTPSPDVLLVA